MAIPAGPSQILFERDDKIQTAKVKVWEEAAKLLVNLNELVQEAVKEIKKPK